MLLPTAIYLLEMSHLLLDATLEASTEQMFSYARNTLSQCAAKNKKKADAYEQLAFTQVVE
jgi:hypothetical protein